MATTAEPGRLCLIKLGNGASPQVYTTVGGVRTTDINIDTGAVEITNKGSAGYQEFLPGGGVYKLDITGQGVFDDANAQIKTIIADASAAPGSQALVPLQIQFANGDLYTSKFIIKSLKRSGPYNDAETFDLSLSSSGTVTFAAGT